MAQIPKFVYALIIFLSVFLVVTYCGGSQIDPIVPTIGDFPCHWDEECEDLLWCDLPFIPKCINHKCECEERPGNGLSRGVVKY
ncbi:hypothetical protein P8452_20126 [Trifolium repens]|nr:hypothetical protein P8452_20126 [Trifolium repens]